MLVNIKAGILNIIGLQTPWGRLVVVFGVTLSLYIISYQSLLSLPTISVFSRLNIPSPSIGLTRAYWLAIHGDLATAWEMNKIVYLVIAVLLALVFADTASIIKGVRTKKSKLEFNSNSTEV